MTPTELRRIRNFVKWVLDIHHHEPTPRGVLSVLIIFVAACAALSYPISGPDTGAAITFLACVLFYPTIGLLLAIGVALNFCVLCLRGRRPTARRWVTDVKAKMRP